MSTTGNTYEVSKIGAKTGRRFIYQVYRATNGTFIARMKESHWESWHEWSEPFDNEEQALKDAMRLLVAKNRAAAARQAEYYRSGGY